MLRGLLLFIIAVFTASLVSAQTRALDSLFKVLKTEKDDTNKVKTLVNIASPLHSSLPDTTILLATQAEALAGKLDWKKGIGMAENAMGLGYWVKGDFDKAVACYKKAINIANDVGNKKGHAVYLTNLGNVYSDMGKNEEALDAYQNSVILSTELGDKDRTAIDMSDMGTVYQTQGNYTKALECYLQALKTDEETGNKRTEADALCNLGVLFKEQNDFNKALDYYQRALKMAEDIGYKKLQANVLSNIGVVYGALGKQDTAIDCCTKALKIDEEMGNKPAVAMDLDNIGVSYFALNNYPKALDYYMQGLKLDEETGDKLGITYKLANIGGAYVKMGKFKEAEDYMKRALQIDSSIHELSIMWQIDEALSQLYDTTGRTRLALTWYKKAMAIKDSIFNVEKNKTITRKEISYQYEKKEALAQAEQDKKDAVAAADKKRQNIITAGVSLVLILVLVFSGLLFSRFRITQKQKVIIEEQKAIVEEKNKDILDSITYAKRLQDAILPPLSVIEKYLPESFVFYKPKDIVAGDFYWMERAGDNILVAAADCTGHGVPGAMVSVVCSNALNRTVKEFKITEPGKILDKTRELVLETFEKSEGEIKDGMDISLCCINTQTKDVQWSGAYNPLWYMQSGEIKELGPDKQPIGKVDSPKPFNTSTIKLCKGDILYLFTDGYADQFGGPKGKKFKYQQLKDKLSAISGQSMAEQKQILQQTLEQWQGNLEQIDDVLVIGIRV